MRNNPIFLWLFAVVVATGGCSGDKNDQVDDELPSGGAGSTAENESASGGQTQQEQDSGIQGGTGAANPNATSGSGGKDPASSTCCNGVLDMYEECDDGCNRDDSDGCTDLCKYPCSSDEDCSDENQCNGVERCDNSSHICQPGENVANGEACGAGLACIEGVCRDTSCDTPEDCSDECNPDATCDQATHQCTTGSPAENKTICNNGQGYCNGGVCMEAVCGNAIQDPSEQCDLGDQNGVANSGCTTSCTIFECGNGTIEGEEECDDGNGENLDGCDSRCRVELVYRVSVLKFITEPAPEYCTYAGNEAHGNASASLFSGLLMEQLGLFNSVNDMMNASFESGDDNVLLQLIDLDDPSAQTADSWVTIGMSTGKPEGNWTGRARDLDFPMSINSANLDSDDQPINTLPAALLIENGKPTLRSTKPTSLDIQAGDFVLSLHDAMVSVPVDPTLSRPADSPDIAASVATPESFGAAQGSEPVGIMCGAMSTSAFDNIPFTQEFALLCPGYTVCAAGQDPSLDECSSFADLIVGGCGIFINAIDPDVDLSGDGVEDAFSLVVVFSQVRIKPVGTVEL